jgi:hypothetical protein
MLGPPRVVNTGYIPEFPGNLVIQLVLSAQMAEEKIRANFGDYLAHAEVAIYSVLALLLFLTALATIGNSGKMLWDGIGTGTGRLPPRRCECWTSY